MMSNPSATSNGLKVFVPVFLLACFGIGMLMMGGNNDSALVDDVSPVTLAAVTNLGPRAVQSPAVQARYSRAIESKLNMYGLSSGPEQQLAISAIEFANRCGT